MAKISEIAPDVFRISIYAEKINLQFNHFLIKDDEPMLFHAGMRLMFPELSAAVGKIIDPSALKWIGFSHFEVDECGALNEWLQLAPQACPVCSEAGALVNMSDFAIRPAHAMAAGEVLNTGKYHFQLIGTPHLPHGWDAGVMFEQNNRTLLCSDLFHQNGNGAALTDKDILDAHKTSLVSYEKGPLMDYSPYSHKTPEMLYSLAGLNPKTLATMHGASYNGDCSQALKDLNEVMKEIWGS